ncbi:hypothetical protein P171DRAFT_440322 [Karstenula rhodostoma CBS 690.94]|uniref:Uncharacterized protein n=1 Tax=Karstenula rhodostoma CBS 690.94 TaxID=1392251 RepID=A0A9P4PVX2_9PLEO|nr:hypothetical protein P171DRAFT_440322 [Karstenula rhodostoma CBS 690.94]
MPRRRRNERSPAAHNINQGERGSPRLTADNMARHAAAMNEAELHRHAEERIARRRANMSEPPRERLTSENLLWHDSNTLVAEEQGPASLTADNLNQHDAEMDEADQPILSAADLARRNAAVNDQRSPHLMRDDFDYRDTSWSRAEHREGWGGLLEPRAGRRK